MTIKTHIVQSLTFIYETGIAKFKTSDIQNLSERSIRFGKLTKSDNSGGIRSLPILKMNG